MKLVFCKNCGTVFSCSRKVKYCECGLSSGKYIDNLHAEIHGEFAIPLGFSNYSFLQAIEKHEFDGENSVLFTAFIIEKNCKTFSRI